MTIIPSQFLYDAFYRFGFAAGILCLIGFGWKRKYPMANWLSFVALSVGLAVLGSRLGAWGGTQWQQFFINGETGDFARRSALGGSAGLLLAFVIGRKGLGIRLEALDAFAIFLPVLMVFQRMGCLFGACCFGLPVENFPGIQYQGSTFLHDHQLTGGWINRQDPLSMPVHAVPLYMAAAALLALGLVLYFWKKLNRPGEKLLFTLWWLALGRGIIEFFRDPVTNTPYADAFHGMKLVQWLLVGTLFLVFLLWRFLPESSGQRTADEAKQIPLPGWFGGMAFFLYLSRSFFKGPEIFVVHILLGAALLAWMLRWIPLKQPFSVRLSPMILILLGLGFMNQTYHDHVQEDSNGTKTIVRASGAYADLNVTQFPCIESGQGCLGPVCLLADSTKPMGPAYFNYSVGVDRYKDLRIKSNLNYGFNGQIEHYYNAGHAYSGFRFNVQPFIGLDGARYAGFRVGLRAGSMFSNEVGNQGNTNFLPTFRFWFGDKSFATFQASLFDSEMIGPYASMGEIRLNTNWHRLSGGKVGQGSLAFGFNENTTQAYAQMELYLNPRTAITPRLGVVMGGDLQNSSSLGGYTAGLGLRIDLQPH